jgi:hypothetical protein
MGAWTRRTLRPTAALSVKTLAMKRCNGTGPKFVKLGRIFYFREDLDAWLQRGRVVSTAQAQQR